MVLSYILYKYLYTNCILVIWHRDGSHNSDWNMLLKNNNMWLNRFINIHLLVYHINTEHTLMHGYGMHEVQEPRVICTTAQNGESQLTPRSRPKNLKHNCVSTFILQTSQKLNFTVIWCPWECGFTIQMMKSENHIKRCYFITYLTEGPDDMSLLWIWQGPQVEHTLEWFLLFINWQCICFIWDKM